MIQIKSRAMRLVPYNVVWFADKPSKWKCLFSYYKQSACHNNIPGYRREPFFTKTIDIGAPQAVFEAGFDQNTNYEIRRAIKDGVTTAPETEIKRFIDFYNLFAVTKNLPTLTREFYKFQSCLVITKAIYQDQDIVMHAYLRDDSLKRVRLLHSASLFRTEKDNQLKAVIGRANRLLHFKDMCFFKQHGFEVYDMGGYAHGTADEALKRINQFKDSFGGNLVQESDYLPVLGLVLMFFTRLLKA
jgi:hypothetical protein